MAQHPSILERILVSYARGFPIRKGKLRLVNSLWQAAAGDGNPQRLAQLQYGGFRMQCDLREMLQRQFYFFGTYFIEENALRFWQTAARDAKVIFDVGANAGIYSLAALAVQPAADVHAFEPTPEIAARLRGTAELNGLPRLHVHQSAVFAGTGHAVLKRFRGEGGNNEGMNFISSGDEAGAERVATVSLDQFCAEQSIERIDLLKLDIQGHEYNALLGARDLLIAGRIGMIFTELNWAPESNAHCSASQSIRLLSEAGYEFSEPAEPPSWKKAGDWMRKHDDIFARRPR